jgi:hypothetical protein
MSLDVGQVREIPSFALRNIAIGILIIISEFSSLLSSAKNAPFRGFSTASTRGSRAKRTNAEHNFHIHRQAAAFSFVNSYVAITHIEPQRGFSLPYLFLTAYKLPFTRQSSGASWPTERPLPIDRPIQIKSPRIQQEPRNDCR